jgi:ureidoglycolate dehydrogenase (NAD+)
LLAIDPTVAMPFETFTTRVDDLIDQVHASPPAAGVHRIYVPGERSAEMARARERDGVTLSAERVTELRAVGESCSVAWPA